MTAADQRTITKLENLLSSVNNSATDIQQGTNADYKDYVPLAQQRLTARLIAQTDATAAEVNCAIETIKSDGRDGAVLMYRAS